MELQESEKSSEPEEGSQLNRNRSFKSKQLVRSQAIRESHSPPRSAAPSPSVDDVDIDVDVAAVDDVADSVNVAVVERQSDDVQTDGCSEDCKRGQPVEIQITPGWESPVATQRGPPRQSQLLSLSPRVACVCGACQACTQCRGRKRRQNGPTKQDSGIGCCDDCPDCSDDDTDLKTEVKQPVSLDSDEQASYCRCPERKEKPKTPLTRTDSDDRTEPTGPEVVNFIRETLNKNPRDRITLLKIEKELHALVNDPGRCIVRFPVMTSYGRMLVHRCAALFQLTHRLDQINKTCVIVSKSGTSGGRIPCTNFREWCEASFSPTEENHENAKFILKRGAASLEESGAGSSAAPARSKSLEQRERDYESARRRIFSTDNCSQDESQWPWLPTGPVKLLTPETGKKLLKVQSLESSGPALSGRGPVSKSHSFGGYGGSEPQPRLLSRQGDLASSSWRLSPSSSGYKTLSLRSTDSVTPSPTGGGSPEPGVVWCVSDMSAVPRGALLLHPQTGRPVTNPDGSVYHFDPEHPPPLYDTSYIRTEPKSDKNVDKRRGKLEKQHSFIDTECECQTPEECRGNWYCESRRQDIQQRGLPGKTPTPPEQTPAENPAQKSPSKNRYVPAETVELANNTTPHITSYDCAANQNHAAEQTTNQHQVYEAPPNHRYDKQRYENTRQQSYDNSANQRAVYESQRPQSYEAANQKVAYEGAANQRTPDHNQRMFVNKLASHESLEVQQYVPQAYIPAYRHDETTPPQAMQMQYIQPELMPAVGPKLTVPMDPNLPFTGGMSLTNMVYPAPMGQPYQYVNQCRMEPQMHPAMYQHMVQEEQKLAPAQPDTGFRIDPSYQFAMADPSCGACVAVCDQTATHAGAYPTGVDSATLAGGGYAPLQPIPQHMHYPYQDASWLMGGTGHKITPEMMPVMPSLYPTYKLVYPPVIPQPYPICQPVYPVIDNHNPEPRRNSISSNKQSKHNSVSGSARNTPATTPDDKVPYEREKIQTQNTNQPNNSQNPRLSHQNSNLSHHNSNLSQQNSNLSQQNSNLSHQNPSNQNSSQNSNVNQNNSNANQYNPNYNHHNSNYNHPNSNYNHQNSNYNHQNSNYSLQNPNYNHQNSRLIRQNSNEIAVKIQQIKEQMAQMSTRDNKRENYRKDDWRARNNGSGILGSYPVNNYNGRNVGRQSQDDTQLTSAARAIVNSIRQMQAKNHHTYPDRRPDYRVDRRRERPDGPHSENAHIKQGPTDERYKRVPFQYRPPYFLRQMSPGGWCRRSPGPTHPVLNAPRRPFPDTRSRR